MKTTAENPALNLLIAAERRMQLANISMIDAQLNPGAPNMLSSDEAVRPMVVYLSMTDEDFLAAALSRNPALKAAYAAGHFGPVPAGEQNL